MSSGEGQRTAGWRLRSFAGVVGGAVNEFLADNCPHLAAAISYYLLLSLFPLVLAAISVLGFLLRSPDVEARVIQAVTDFIPGSASFVPGIVSDVADARGAAGAIATVGLIWAGMGVFNAIRKSLNTAWGTKQPRPFLLERLMEFGMMLGVGVLMVLSLALTTAFKIIREASLPILGQHFMQGDLLSQAAVIGTSVFVTFLGFLFVYKFVPNTRVYWRHAVVGALVAAVLFEIVKDAFVWFVGNFGTYNIVYGSVGVVVALLTWVYVSAVIFLFCAKLISTYAKTRPKLAEETAGGPVAAERPEPASAAAYGMLPGSFDGMGALRRLMLGRSEQTRTGRPLS